MKGEINRVLTAPLEKIDVIPNGVDAKKFDFDFPDAADFRTNYAAPDEKIIFHVGRNVREKGAQVLIDAFSKVLNEYLKAKLVIVGGGNRQWLKDQAAALEISDRVYFTGFVPDDVLLKIYKISDVAVFPSLYEPFGIVALEAMAAKVPVIVSDVCGLKEVVDNDINGITTYVEDPNSIAWGILRFLNMTPGQRNVIVEAAYRKATTVFSWERIAEQTQAVYDRVIGEYKTAEWK
jgi:glycosyltransferase involved in cell wall biosynthesis